MRFIQLRSAPAEKLLPLAASTTTRTSGAWSSRRSSVGQLRDQVVVEGVVHVRTIHPDSGDASLNIGLQHDLIHPKENFALA